MKNMDPDIDSFIICSGILNDMNSIHRIDDSRSDPDPGMVVDPSTLYPVLSTDDFSNMESDLDQDSDSEYQPSDPEPVEDKSSKLPKLIPVRRRGGRRKNGEKQPPVMAPPSPEIYNNPELLEAYRNERNRLAAKRSRENKKAYITSLEAQSRSIRGYALEKEMEVNKLKNDLRLCNRRIQELESQIMGETLRKPAKRL